MQCLVCKHSNPDHLAKCEICDSELISSNKDTKNNYCSWILCEPMKPIKLEMGKEYSFGREHTCTVVLSSGNVSRINTVFKVTPDGVSVEDNDSRNGTFLNGVKLLAIQPNTLKDNDNIRIGPYNLKYRYVPGPIEDYIEKITDDVIISDETIDLDTGDISGDLAKNKCADILQMIELTKKTGLLEIHVKLGGKGTFYFHDGMAVHATFLDLSGIDAARKLIPLKEGSFKFNNLEKISVPHSIDIPTHKLILDSLRLHDEDTRKIRKRIELNKAPSDEEILEEELSSHIPKFDFFSDVKKDPKKPE